MKKKPKNKETEHNPERRGDFCVPPPGFVAHPHRPFDTSLVNGPDDYDPVQFGRDEYCDDFGMEQDFGDL